MACPSKPATTQCPSTPAATQCPSTPAVTQCPSKPAVIQCPSTPAVTQCPSAPSVTQCPSTPAGSQSVTKFDLSCYSLDLRTDSGSNITAYVTPTNAASVSWRSNNTSVATVSGGRVNAVGAGYATITATAGGLSKDCTVKVTTAVTGVEITNSPLFNLLPNREHSLGAVVFPLSATDKKIAWSSSDNSVAWVNSNGLITTVKDGTVVITVKTNDGNKTASCTIKVKTPKIYLSPENINKSSPITEDFYKYERDQMIPLTNEVSKYLSKYGYDVTVGFNAEATGASYATGRYEESNRMYDSNPNGINLHVCIHSNSGSPGIQTVFGPEIYHQNKNNRYGNFSGSKKFAETVYSKLFALYQKSFPLTKKRGTYGDGLIESINPEDGKEVFVELRETKATAIYVETAYHDNIADAHWIIDNKISIAKAIGDGIIAYANKL